MPSVGFEPTIPVFERAKTIYALDRAATVIGMVLVYEYSSHRVLLLDIKNSSDEECRLLGCGAV
jgi:hypothetical protein